MIKILDLKNIKIASVNKKYGYNPKSGKLYLTKEYKDFKNLVTKSVIIPNEIIEKPYCVKVEVETPHDIDNYLKPLFDALEKSSIIENDKYICKLTVKKKTIKKGTKSSIRVFLGSCEEEFNFYTGV
jgi:Holliday junction resolvase RusA-like endonuclease